MIVLDENFPRGQRELLKSWRFPARQIGIDLGREGMKDDELIPFLVQLTRPTHFTLDRGWYERKLVHKRYGIFVLECRFSEAAAFTRRVLRYPEFNTQAKRLGKVVRASHDGLTGWTLASESEQHWDWT